MEVRNIRGGLQFDFRGQGLFPDIGLKAFDCFSPFALDGENEPDSFSDFEARFFPGLLHGAHHVPGLALLNELGVKLKVEYGDRIVAGKRLADDAVPRR